MSMTTTTDGGDSMRRSAVRNPKRRPRITEGSNSPNGRQPKRSKLNKHVDAPQTLDTTESLRSGLSALAVQTSASFSRTGDAGTRHKRPLKHDNSTLLVIPPNIYSVGINC